MLNKQLEEKYGLFSDQGDIDNIQKILLLNRAVFDSTAQLADAFNTGRVNPIGLIDLVGSLSWKSLSKEEKDLFIQQQNELRKEKGWKPLTEMTAPMYYGQQQKQKLAKLKKDEENYKAHLKTHASDEETLAGDVDGEVIMRDAFKHLLEYEIDQMRERRSIAHREHLRDDVSPDEVIEAAGNGDPDAKVIAGATETPKAEEPQAESVSDEKPETSSTASVEEPITDTSSASDESAEPATSASAADETPDTELGNLSLEGDEDFEDNGNLSLDTSGKSQSQIALEEQLGYTEKRKRKSANIEDSSKEENVSEEDEELANESIEEVDQQEDVSVSDEIAEPIDRNKDLD